MMNDVVECLRENRAFVIAGHSNPDGDSLGSAMALALGLERLGKKAVVVSADTVTAPYRRLPMMERVRHVEALPEGYPVAVLVECSGTERTGLVGFEGRILVNIDHHSKNPRFGDVNWIDADVAATGVMVYRLLRELGAEITPEIATHIYVTILTDTGSFRYSNVDPTTFKLCAELLELGVDPAAVATSVYDNVPLGKARLLGAALSTLRLHRGGSVASMIISFEAFQQDPGDHDTEGIVNHAQRVEGVDVALLFKEIEPDRYRVSLRSNGAVDVAVVAAEFGGGGHPRAAGCLIEGTFEKVQHRVLQVVERELSAGQA